MKHKLISAASLAVAVLLFAGCGDNAPRLDTSTTESYDATFEAMEKVLPANEKEKLDAAIKTIAFHFLNLEDEKAGQKAMYKAVDGKTAKQLIALADKLKNKK